MISKAYLGRGVYMPVSQMTSSARRTLSRKIKGGRLAQESAATTKFNADARKFMDRTNRQLMRGAKPIAAPAGMDKTRKGAKVNWFESKNLSHQGVGGFQLNTGGRRAPRNIVVNSDFNQAAMRRKPDPAVRTEMANIRRHEFQHAQPNVSSWRVMQQSGMDTPKKFHRRKDGVVNRTPALSREEARASYMAGDRYSAKTARGRGVYLTASRNQSDPGSRALRAQMRDMERKGVRSGSVSPDGSEKSPLALLDRFERADVKARRNAAMRARRKVTKSMGIEAEVPQAEGSKEPVYTRARDESGRFIGTLHMGNSLPTQMVEGRREVSKALFKPKLPKPPTVPKPKVPKNVLGTPKPAAVPQTTSPTAKAPRIRETGVSKAGHPDWHGWGKTRVPTTRKERTTERAKNAGGSALFGAGTSGAITYGMNFRRPGRGRAALGAAGVGAGLGAVIGAAQKPKQVKLVAKSERGELVARQIPRDKQLRSTRVRKMSPDPSELHVMGAPQATSARRAAAQRAARTRKLRYLTPTRMNQAPGR